MRLRVSSFSVVALGMLICAGGLAVAVMSWKARPNAAAPEAVRPREAAITAARPAEADVADANVTAADLQRALQQTAAKLVNIQIAVVERGNSTDRQPGVPIPVVFKQIWMHGQSAQALYDQRDDIVGESWWENFQPVNGSLTPADLLSRPGLKLCVDLTRLDVVWADSLPLRRERSASGESPALHSLSKSPQWLGDVFLPLIELDKPWALPQRFNGQPIVNAVARRPLSSWHVLGEERLGEIDCVKVEIDRQDTVEISLQRHEGKLSLTPSWLVWFSKSQGWMPVRVEGSARYGYQGKQYQLARRDDGLAGFVYEASDFVQVGDIWFPRRGRQDTYASQNQGNKTSSGFDFDGLVDKLLTEGMLSVKGELQLRNRREWRVLSIGSIDPSLGLWFEPPPGAEVVNMDTGKRFVQGDAVASAKLAAREGAIEALIGKPAPEFPKDASWLNGQPLTWQALRGQVVILDFWADWCGPCRSALPKLSQLHNGRATNGLTIIGVHPPGSELVSIRKVMDEFDLAYPICIDVPNRRGTKSAGDLFAQYAIDGIPHCVVVDASGVVVASESNRFEEALAAAKKLAKPSFQP